MPGSNAVRHVENLEVREFGQEVGAESLRGGCRVRSSADFNGCDGSIQGGLGCGRGYVGLKGRLNNLNNRFFIRDENALAG